MTTTPHDKALTQDTIDRVAAALESADIGHSMKLIRLVDGVHSYTLTIRGAVEEFIDNDEANAIDQVYARIREVKHRLQAEAVIGALHAPLSVAGKGDGWISVTDKLPSEQGCDSEEVLCFLSGHCELHDRECRKGAGWGIRLGFYDAERFVFRCGGRPAPEVTHWRPLPAPPSLQSDTEGGV